MGPICLGRNHSQIYPHMPARFGSRSLSNCVRAARDSSNVERGCGLSFSSIDVASRMARQWQTTQSMHYLLPDWNRGNLKASWAQWHCSTHRLTTPDYRCWTTNHSSVRWTVSAPWLTGRRQRWRGAATRSQSTALWRTTDNGPPHLLLATRWVLRPWGPHHCDKAGEDVCRVWKYVVWRTREKILQQQQLNSHKVKNVMDFFYLLCLFICLPVLRFL